MDNMKRGEIYLIFTFPRAVIFTDYNIVKLKGKIVVRGTNIRFFTEYKIIKDRFKKNENNYLLYINYTCFYYDGLYPDSAFFKLIPKQYRVLSKCRKAIMSNK